MLDVFFFDYIQEHDTVTGVLRRTFPDQHRYSSDSPNYPGDIQTPFSSCQYYLPQK